MAEGVFGASRLYRVPGTTFRTPKVCCDGIPLCLICVFFVFDQQAKIKVLAEGISSLADGEEPLAKCNSRIEVADGLILKQV